MRAFLVPNLTEGDVVALPEKEARHAARVLRLKEGDEIALFDGKGRAATGKILSSAGGDVRVTVTSVHDAGSAGTKLIVLQAQLKGPKMDWLVEKLTELGVHSIRVVDTKFSVAQREKTDRWERVAQAASKQSGNPQLPDIHAPMSFSQTLDWARRQSGTKILLSPGAKRSLLAQLQSQGPQDLVLAVGPEGGFSPEEEAELESAGFVAARLSRHVLRGETAAIAAASIAVHAFDF